MTEIWERSSVWLERMPVTHEVASSSLVVPAIIKSPLDGLFFIDTTFNYKEVFTVLENNLGIVNSADLAREEECSVSGILT